MKKLLVLLFLLLVSSLLFSADINCEIKNTSGIQNFTGEPSYTLDNSAKLDFKSKGDNYYGEISAKAIYSSSASTTSPSLSFQINRAYTEFYKDNLSFSIGKQRLAWGTGYIFNYADVFNTINFSDPKGEKEGVNSLTQKINIGDTAKIELAEVFKNQKSLDYGARSSFAIGNFELCGNYLKTTSYSSIIPNEYMKRELYIAEFRGELEIGIWGSAAYSVDTFSSPLKPTFSQKLYTLGCDYTIDLGGNMLYFLEETSYNETNSFLIYFGQIKYTPSEDYNISQTITVDSKTLKQMYITTFNYTLNDFITTSLAYGRYIKTNQTFADNKNIENDLVLTFKTNF